MQKQLKKEKLRKIIVCMVLIQICLVPGVQALGVGPMRLDIQVDKGKETEITRSIEVANPNENPVYITGSVTGTVAQFITLDPNEFDLPAGPGIMSTGSRPSRYVKVIIRIPREIPETEYTGEILFSEKPVTGGVIATTASLGVRVTLTIGKMAEAVFPVYINAMIVLLLILLALSIILTVRKKGRKK